MVAAKMLVELAFLGWGGVARARERAARHSLKGRNLVGVAVHGPT